MLDRDRSRTRTDELPLYTDSVKVVSKEARGERLDARTEHEGRHEGQNGIQIV
jgi:hypothetical protein